MRSIQRRDFLQASAASLATLGASTAARAAAEPRPSAGPKVKSPNDSLNVAVVGVNGRGKDHVRGFLGLKEQGVRLAAICDVDEDVVGGVMRAIESSEGSAPQYVKDVRRLLDDPGIDVISVATPNHWHSLMGIWACQAGKDAYIEKPVSHNVWEGRKLVEAARKYDRIVQCGTQCRSHKGIQDAMEFLRSGKLGTIYMAKGLCYKPRGSIGHGSFQPVPKNLDYDLWTGPAQFHKPGDPTVYNPNILHYNWHWVWNTGNGDLGNQGIHQMDLARWGIGKDHFPNTVQSAGGRYGYDDDGETANTQTVNFEYDDVLLQFEVRGLPTNDEMGVKIGDIFYGTEGILTITSYTNWQTYFGHKMEPGPSGSGGGDHYANFIEAVRTRDRSILNAEIEQGHLSSAFCHLGNIALRLGRKLHIDPATESFVDDEEANVMLRRDYREPYVVPETV
ncbi:Gfo/Idh/MocA family protein [Tautonia sociabilis]|uniref:Gfo/Idh/MocA family oxidoreductase n=1 Tax=Tautonia sociabilis TaxID=2080755 RepID=A0A432MP14_9BACT|nr:Gfo/Idh/MocA family oxidoreductase [Tautonia sociabilis]RUL89060.1 Gfo/Idh/MocA family oxidoreductase [Tautonia sociabilis]